MYNVCFAITGVIWVSAKEKLYQELDLDHFSYGIGIEN